jgi:hypothetical protein
MRLEDIAKLLKGKKFLRVEVTYVNLEKERKINMFYVTNESLTQFPEQIFLYDDISFRKGSKNPVPINIPRAFYAHNIDKITLLKVR